MSFDEARYYTDLARAFVRGSRPELSSWSDAALLDAASARGMKLHKFKRTMELPRVRRVLGALRQLTPQRLLDVGSGRGVFLWPLLDQFPELQVAAVDEDEVRARDLAAVARGGISRLQAHRMDASKLDFPDASFDVVTLLEVLEHVSDPAPVAREALRVSRAHVIASVPSEPDDNPEHIRLFDPRSLTRLFEAAGAARVSVESVRGHFIAFATTATS